MAEEFGRNGGEREPPLDLLAATPGDIRPFLKWAAIIVGLVVLFGLVSFGRSVYTDLLWFDSLGLRSIFLKVTVTRIALFAIGTVAGGGGAGCKSVAGEQALGGRDHAAGA